MMDDYLMLTKNCEYTRSSWYLVISAAGQDNIIKATSAKSHMIKGDLKVDFVTKTDKENEKLIYDRLYSMFPDYDFIGRIFS